MISIPGFYQQYSGCLYVFQLFVILKAFKLVFTLVKIRQEQGAYIAATSPYCWARAKVCCAFSNAAFVYPVFI
jgi:hypothetical protein